MTDTLNPTAPTPINDIAKQGSSEAGFVSDARKRLGEAYETSSEVIGAVYETAIEAVKERPAAAAAIGAGVAAAVAGVTYGASRMKSARAKSGIKT